MRDNTTLERLQLLSDGGDTHARAELAKQLLRHGEFEALNALFESDPELGRRHARQLMERGLERVWVLGDEERELISTSTDQGDLIRGPLHRPRFVRFPALQVQMRLRWDADIARGFACDCVEHVLPQQLSFEDDELEAAREAIAMVRRTLAGESVERDVQRRVRQQIEHHAHDRTATEEEPFRGARAAMRAAAHLVDKRTRSALKAVFESRRAAGEAAIVGSWLEDASSPDHAWWPGWGRELGWQRERLEAVLLDQRNSMAESQFR